MNKTELYTTIVAQQDSVEIDDNYFPSLVGAESMNSTELSFLQYGLKPAIYNGSI